MYISNSGSTGNCLVISKYILIMTDINEMILIKKGNYLGFSFYANVVKHVFP